MSATDIINHYTLLLDQSIDYLSSMLIKINNTIGIAEEFKKFTEYYQIVIDTLKDWLINEYYLEIHEDADPYMMVIDEQIGMAYDSIFYFNKNEMREVFGKKITLDKYPTVTGLIQDYIKEKLKKHSLTPHLNILRTNQ